MSASARPKGADSEREVVEVLRVHRPAHIEGARVNDRACERCGGSLGGAAPMRATARQPDAGPLRGNVGLGRVPLAADPTQTPGADTARRAHASCEALRRLEGCLDTLTRQLSDADARLLARIMRDALRDGGEAK
jgi:hypothetical protein